MSDGITIDKIEDNLNFFKKMYDVVRIVDPLCKRVVDYSDSLLKATDDICYEYWVDGKICDNCISIRAHIENKTFIKLEQTENVTMLVTAIPIEHAKTPIIVELLKNATDTMLIGQGNYKEGYKIKTIVDDFNQKIVNDSLTSLNNRRFINERLPADIVKATIQDYPLSVIFMDIDNLKDINDEYGHTTGDNALKEVGSAIKSCVRNELDWAARYGGDEFIIGLNNANYKEAEIVADRICDSINKISISSNDKLINLTVSIGIYTMIDAKLTAEELIREADKKMYEAKKARKNNH
ncbi:MAG: GGDEF domain-containing protein [Tissierella sp.]|nr:GGDEF domain-containing protein [Tissierella sp.]